MQIGSELSDSSQPVTSPHVQNKIPNPPGGLLSLCQLPPSFPFLLQPFHRPLVTPELRPALSHFRTFAPGRCLRRFSCGCPLPPSGRPSSPSLENSVLHLSPSRYPIFLDRTSHSATWFSSLLQPQCLEHSRCLISMCVSPKSTSLLFRLQSHMVNFLLDVCRVFRELPHLNRSKTVSLLPKPGAQLPKPFAIGPC